MFQNTEHIRTSLTQVNKQNRDIRKPSNPNLLCVLWFCIINLTVFFKVFRGVQDLCRCTTSGNRKYFGKSRQVFLWLLGAKFSLARIVITN